MLKDDLFDRSIYRFYSQLDPETKYKRVSQYYRPKLVKAYKPYFISGYGRYITAFNVLRERYEFYIGLLQGQYKEYMEQVGEEQLIERVVLALCDIDTVADNLYKGSEQFCDTFFKRVTNGEYNAVRMVSLGGMSISSDCEKTGVCVCEGSKPPYMSQCLTSGGILGKVRTEEDLKNSKKMSRCLKKFMYRRGKII